MGDHRGPQTKTSDTHFEMKKVVYLVTSIASAEEAPYNSLVVVGCPTLVATPLFALRLDAEYP
jgi:hypothetical protein